jgi:hypothetical protein
MYCSATHWRSYIYVENLLFKTADIQCMECGGSVSGRYEGAGPCVWAPPLSTESRNYPRLSANQNAAEPHACLFK